ACRTGTCYVEREGVSVRQQVYQVVVQQVHLVHVQDAAVRRRQQARLERLDALGEGPLDVEGPGDPVLGRADRQLHQRRRATRGRAARIVRPVRARRIRDRKSTRL